MIVFYLSVVYYRVHKTPLQDPVLSQMNPVHTLTC